MDILGIHSKSRAYEQRDEDFPTHGAYINQIRNGKMIEEED
jgi:hypothetical protein